MLRSGQGLVLSSAGGARVGRKLGVCGFSALAKSGLTKPKVDQAVRANPGNPAKRRTEDAALGGPL